MQEVVTLAARLLQAGIGLARRGPDKQIDHVLAPLINQGGHGPVVEVIEAPADQGEATIRKIVDCRRKIQLAVEPGFHRVAV